MSRVMTGRLTRGGAAGARALSSENAEFVQFKRGGRLSHAISRTQITSLPPRTRTKNNLRRRTPNRLSRKRTRTPRKTHKKSQ